MTPELLRRLEETRPPFDGRCVHNSGDLDLSQLRQILEFAFKGLSRRDVPIFRFRDWHEHDGFIVESVAVDWSDLHSSLANTRQLYDSRDRDFAVRTAVYPASHDWLVRYNIDDDDESDYRTATCDFDLSVALEAESSELLDDLLEAFPQSLESCRSQSWFHSSFGG